MLYFKFQGICKKQIWVFFRFIMCKANKHTYSNIHLFTKSTSSYSFVSYTFLDNEKKGEKWVTIS